LSENQQSLRFSLEESVWFKKGQEVEELLSISLDPHITILEQEQYVVIQGKLHLSGEYKSSGEAEEDQLWQGKLIQTVEYREEEGVYEFEHQFPVDVTIPKGRVENVEFLDVIVDSFDYVLPENGCLKLTADLTISGLRNEEQAYEELEEEESLLFDSPPEHRTQEKVENDESKQESSRDYEVLNEHEEDEEESSRDYEVLNDHKEDDEELSRDYEVLNEHEDDDEEASRDYEVLNEHEEDDEELVPILNLSRNDSFDNNEDELDVEDEIYLPFSVEVRKAPTNENDSQQSNININPASAYGNNQLVGQEQEVFNVHQFPKAAFEESTGINRKNKKVIDDQEESSSSSFTEIAMVDVDESYNDEQYVDDKVEEVEEPKKKKKKGKYESISLTDFFARKQEERAAKLRVCIVQSGETLDHLAEKYDISVQQILRMNHLEINQNIFEGQVLYIPSYAGKS
jgi:stage VI sporulation protein D